MHFSLASIICQILALFMLLCVSKTNGGTCLSYGHSCWGGHGKRDGGNFGVGQTKHAGSWYLSKLFSQPIENSKAIENLFKSLRPNYDEVDKLQQNGYQLGLYPVPEIAENLHRQESGRLDGKSIKWGGDGSESDEVVMMTPEMQQVPLSKYRFLEILNQEESKKRNQKYK